MSSYTVQKKEGLSSVNQVTKPMDDVSKNILPKTVNGLTDRFIERFDEFVCNGKAEHKNELMSLLNELLCKNGITKGQYNLLKHEIKKILDNPRM